MDDDEDEYSAVEGSSSCYSGRKRWSVGIMSENQNKDKKMGSGFECVSLLAFVRKKLVTVKVF